LKAALSVYGLLQKETPVSLIAAGVAGWQSI
jgi:hypothetical protein